MHKEVVSINNKFYKVSSAIFHHGKSIENGHYTNMIYNNNIWFRVNDESIQPNAVWPEFVKDVYMIFLEECSEQCMNNYTVEPSAAFNCISQVQAQSTAENINPVTTNKVSLSNNSSHENNNNYNGNTLSSFKKNIRNGTKVTSLDISSKNDNLTQFNSSKIKTAECSFMQQYTSVKQISQKLIHLSLLSVSSAVNKDKQKRYQRNKKYRKSNQEKLNAKKRAVYKVTKTDICGKQRKKYQLTKQSKSVKHKASYLLHKESVCRRNKKYYETHKDQIATMKREYYQKNRDRILAYNNKKKAASIITKKYRKINANVTTKTLLQQEESYIKSAMLAFTFSHRVPVRS